MCPEGSEDEAIAAPGAAARGRCRSVAAYTHEQRNKLRESALECVYIIVPDRAGGSAGPRLPEFFPQISDPGQHDDKPVRASTPAAPDATNMKISTFISDDDRLRVSQISPICYDRRPSGLACSLGLHGDGNGRKQSTTEAQRLSAIAFPHDCDLVGTCFSYGRDLVHECIRLSAHY